jgi:aspartate aminotransferase
MSEAFISVQAFDLGENFLKGNSIISNHDLRIGEPKLSDFPVDIFEELHHIKNINSYYPSHGDEELRELILNKYYPDQSLKNIAITHGTMGALDFIFRANLNQDDEILIPDPGFAPYCKIAEFAKANIKKYFINLDPKSETCINWDQVESLITSRTKIILINSPHNPTGKTLTEIDYFRFLDLLKNHPHVSYILDEVYRDLIYGNKFHHEFSYFIERGYVVSSFSKMYPLQGARIGWILTSDEKMKKISPYLNHATGAMSSFGQEISKKLLKRNITFRNKYSEALEDAKKILDTYQVEYLDPEGAFFIFIKYKIESSIATKELANLGVDVVSGSTFGDQSKNYIRVSFAQESNTLHQALEIIAKHWSLTHSGLLQ